MDYILGGRRYGKTRKCLEWVLMDNEPTSNYPFWQKIILCISPQEAKRLRSELRRMARSRGVQDPNDLIYNMVYSTEEWNRAQIGRESVKVMLDNADLFLQQMFRGQLAGMTLTEDEHDKIIRLDSQNNWRRL